MKIMRLNLGIGLAAALFLHAAGAAAAEAGRVLVAVGDVVAVRAGKDVPLARDSVVESGDSLRLGADSNAQIRFTDGALVALRPNTQFRIDDYAYAQTPESAGRAFFSLLQGGMRTITGLIGKLRHKEYGVRTPTSTIGIRGTHYSLRHCIKDCASADGTLAPDGTYGGVFEGGVNVSNDGGEGGFGKDEYFYVADVKTPPQRLIAPPDFLADRLLQVRTSGAPSGPGSGSEGQGGPGPAGPGGSVVPPPAPPAFVATESKNAAGGSAAIGDSSPGGEGGSPAYAFAWSYAGSNYTNSSADPNVAGPEGMVLADVQSVGSASGGASRNGSPLAGAGSSTAAGNVYWGRWTSGLGNYPTANTPLGGIHLAMGTATPTSAIPTSGVVAYTRIGGTAPTDSGGNVGYWLGGSLVFNFASQTVSTGNSLMWTVAGHNYTAAFSGVAYNAGHVVLSNTGSCAGGGCGGSGVPINSLNLNGTWVGSNAQGALLSVSTYTAAATNPGTSSVQVFQSTGSILIDTVGGRVRLPR